MSAYEWSWPGYRKRVKWEVLWALFFCCSLWSGCVTQTTDGGAAASGLQAAADHPSGALQPLLWEIRPPSADKSGRLHISYLFGTIHAGVSTADLPPLVWQKLDKAQALVLEIDPADFKTEKKDLPKQAGEGRSLRAQLGPDDWNKMVSLVVPPDGHDRVPSTTALDEMTPAMAVSLLLLQLFPVSEPMDFSFAQYASSHSKKTVGLETLSFQETLLGKVMDLKMLRKVIANYPSLRGEASSLVAVYRAGDEKALADFMTHSALGDMSMDDRSREELIVRRNLAWIRQMHEMLMDKDVFIAVGAGHLPGSDGLLQLLEKDGFGVQRVSGAAVTQ